jgi:hypothetical protein
MPPRLVIEIARRRGLDGIAITDHDTVEGALAAVKANRHSDLLVIPGIEVKTDLGDVIGLYVDRQIESRGFGEVIQEIHDIGGVVYLPHPIRTFGAERTAAIHAAYPDIDLWELYNGRYAVKEFAQSHDVFESLGIGPRLCGSDAHFPWDIGVFRTVLDGCPHNPGMLLQLSRTAQLQAVPRGDLALSAGISLGAVTKAFKHGEYWKVARSLAMLPPKAVLKAARALRAISH